MTSSYYNVGVTSFEHSRASSNSPYFYVGSYDDSVSVWDIRRFKSPLVSENVGGGVWRIRTKLCEGRDKLALATMYDGFTIIGTLLLGSNSLTTYVIQTA